MPRKIQVLVIDFGSQYTQLIARRLRELGVFSTVCSATHSAQIAEIDQQTRGIILSGGPGSVSDHKMPKIELDKLPKNVPVLGICYGAQLIAQQLGGKVSTQPNTKEYGKTIIKCSKERGYLLKGVKKSTQVWMSHGDSITELPEELKTTASSTHVPCTAFEAENGRWAGLQFHPEVAHTTEGTHILSNFVEHCGCARSWDLTSFAKMSVEALKKRIGEQEEVIIALSGGVDSSVAALLLHKAIGARLRGIFVDNGLLREGEYEEVLAGYEKLGLNVLGIRKGSHFYGVLRGISDPEAKRKAIGGAFIDVFSEQAQRFPKVRWLAQGTIYPDRIESQAVLGPSQTIKSHHNVGGLPKNMPFKLVEPLDMLFKDEVREVGKVLGLPDQLLYRHPFPGPGLGIRVVGEVTEEKVKILQVADAIFINALRKERLYAKVWQAGAILLPVRSVGVQGDKRSYAQALVLRAVVSQDGMTAESATLPQHFLHKVGTEIMNKTHAINRVLYDISSKPPATIEWE